MLNHIYEPRIFFKEKDLWCRFASKPNLNLRAAKIFEYMQELFFFNSGLERNYKVLHCTLKQMRGPMMGMSLSRKILMDCRTLF